MRRSSGGRRRPTAWVRETFAEAGTANAAAVVIAFHANPGLEGGQSPDYRYFFEPFLTALEEEVEAFGKPVLIAQGDNHTYTVDQPIVRRTTGRLLENLTRLQVPGSPAVGWVRSRRYSRAGGVLCVRAARRSAMEAVVITT